MAKVDWITWKTDPSEIINPKLVNEKIDELFLNYDNYMKPSIYDEMKKEIIEGGLSEGAYSIANSNPINTLAVDILGKIDDIESTVEKIKNSITNTLIEQKESEKEQLISAVREKILIEEELKRRIETNENVRANIMALGNDPDDIIDIINDRLNRLNSKLLVVEKL